MNRIKYCALALAALASTSLAACGSDNDAAPAAGGTTATSAQDLTAITTEPVTLEVWGTFAEDTAPGAVGPAIADLDAAFNEQYPNITIEHKTFPYDTYITPTVRTAITAQKGPDIVQMWGGTVADDYRSGLLALDNYLASDPTLADNLLLLESFVGPDGSIRAVPYTGYASTFAYNESVLGQAGLGPTDIPSTWDEFLTTCEVLSDAGVVPIAAGWKDGFLHNWYQAVFVSQLLEPSEFDQLTRLELPFTSEPFRASREYLLEMEDHRCFDENATALTIVESLEQFSAGNAALFLWQGAPDPSWDGVVRPPVLPDSKVGAEVLDAGANLGFAITEWSDHPNEAWAYIDFLIGESGQTIMTNLVDAAPNYLGVVGGQADSEMAKEYLAMVNTQGNRTITFAIPPSVQALNERLAVPLMDKSMSIDDLLERLEDERLKVVETRD